MKKFTDYKLGFENFEFESLEKLEIKKELNNHSTVYLRGIIDSNNKEKYKQYLESEAAKINLTHGEDGKTLFKGMVDRFNIQYNSYNQYFLEIIGISYTINLEKSFNNRIFQNKGTMYTDVFEKIMEKNEIFDIQFSNSELESSELVNKEYPLVLQHKESEWDFLKRISSYLNLPIVIDDTKDDSEIINIKIGVHDLDSKELNNISGSKRRIIGKDYIHNYYKINEHSHSRSKDIYDVGTPVKYLINNTKKDFEEGVILKNRIYLKDSRLLSDFVLVKKEDIDIKKVIRENSIEGRSFRGQIKKLKKDHTAQVEFVDLENEYKGSKSFWFPIDKPYTGIYFSPEIDDIVDIYFKGKNEKYATLKSSSTDNDKKDNNNPKEKRIITDTLQEIVLNDEDESITITSLVDKSLMKMNEEEIKIINSNTTLKLKKDGEVTLSSEDRELNIGKDGFIIISDGNTVQMTKSGLVVEGSSGEKVDMSTSSIEVSAGGKSITIGNGMVDLA